MFDFVTLSAEEATLLSTQSRKPSEDYYDLVDALEVGSGAKVDLDAEGMPTKVTFRRNLMTAATDREKGILFRRTRDNSVIFTVVTVEAMNIAHQQSAEKASVNGNGTPRPRGRPRKVVEEAEPEFA